MAKNTKMQTEGKNWDKKVEAKEEIVNESVFLHLTLQ